MGKYKLVGGAMCPSWKMMEFVNGKDDIPCIKWKIKFMFQTTNQPAILWWQMVAEQMRNDFGATLYTKWGPLDS